MCEGGRLVNLVICVLVLQEGNQLELIEFPGQEVSAASELPGANLMATGSDGVTTMGPKLAL